MPTPARWRCESILAYHEPERSEGAQSPRFRDPRRAFGRPLRGDPGARASNRDLRSYRRKQLCLAGLRRRSLRTENRLAGRKARVGGQVLLAHHLRQLKLPTFLREYEKVAAEAAREGLDHVRFLLRLAELELID